MLRRARILLALFVLSALCTSPALWADDAPPAAPPAGGEPANQPSGGDPDCGDPDCGDPDCGDPNCGDPLALLLQLLGLGDEFNPQHLPGG